MTGQHHVLFQASTAGGLGCLPSTLVDMRVTPMHHHFCGSREPNPCCEQNTYNAHRLPTIFCLQFLCLGCSRVVLGYFPGRTDIKQHAAHGKTATRKQREASGSNGKVSINTKHAP